MKKGEKGALLLAGGLMAAIAGLTFYLESQVNLGPMTSEIPQSARQFASPGPGMIPIGINPDALPDAGGHGATLLTIYCVQCHDLPTPTMHTADEWHTVLDRMDKHIQERRGGMLSRVAMPSKKDWTDLHDYFDRHGQKPLDVSAYDDLNSPEGQAFQSSCSQCHAAPDPSQHTASEWPRIVLRMKYNMSDTGKEVPDTPTTEMIVSYLQKHSRQL